MCPYLYNVHEATRMAVVEGYDYDLIGKLSLGSSPHKCVKGMRQSSKCCSVDNYQRIGIVGAACWACEAVLVGSINAHFECNFSYRYPIK